MSIKKSILLKIEQLIERVKKIKKRSIYCIVAGLIFAVLSIFTSNNSIYVRPNEIERGSYGTQKTPYSIKVDAENLAKNIAFKVKRTRRTFTLEPMNPYERRIIHSALQNDKYVATRSEGEEPYRKVVVYLKKA